MKLIALGAVLCACVTTDPDPDTATATEYSDDMSVVGDVDARSLSALTGRIQHAEAGNFDLYFNSPGGSVFDGLDFLREMEAAQRRGVRFVCTADMAASMGAVLFSACDVRLALPRAMILIHSVSMGGGGNARQRREEADDMEAITDALLRQIYRTFRPDVMTFEDLKARTDGRDFWVDAGKAQALGLVQAILP